MTKQISEIVVAVKVLDRVLSIMVHHGRHTTVKASPVTSTRRIEISWVLEMVALARIGQMSKTRRVNPSRAETNCRHGW